LYVIQDKDRTKQHNAIYRKLLGTDEGCSKLKQHF